MKTNNIQETKYMERGDTDPTRPHRAFSDRRTQRVERPTTITIPPAAITGRCEKQRAAATQATPDPRVALRKGFVELFNSLIRTRGRRLARHAKIRV
jgi:hypothetical protein